MIAAQLIQPGHFELSDFPDPVPGPRQALFQVEVCGVCSSNLGPWHGASWFSYPFAPGAPGHEASGRVVALGSEVRHLRVGDWIAALSLHGFAELDLVEGEDAIKLPDEMPAGTFLGEPLGCAINIFGRAGIRPGDTIAVVGIGFLGALLVQLSVAAGATVFAFGRNPDSLQRGRTQGATEAFSTLDAAGVAQVGERTSGQGCPVVIEATGTQSGLDLATQLTAERGRLVIAGYHQDGSRTVNMQLWNWRGLDVINAHERDPAIYRAGMNKALAAVADGRLRLEPLITHRLPLPAIDEAFALADARPAGFTKAVVTNPLRQTFTR